jgi:DNA-binding NtrC family response regulator
MGESLVDRFELEGLAVLWVRTVAQAELRLRDARFDAVVSDVRLTDGSGEHLFEKLVRAGAVLPPWLFITAFASVDRAVAMLQAGARDYVTKPFDIAELVSKVKGAIGVLEQAASPTDALDADDLLGVSASMRLLASQCRRVAERARTLLVTGESGSGKEVLARHIHALAHPGRDAPFVAVNCGAIPEALLESELFGHMRGAFTGAVANKAGKVALAQGGTLFLDELGELPLALQVKLLRLLQNKEYSPVGDTKVHKADVRIVAATNVDLEGAVRAGSFREDLYYRLNVIHLQLPALRERPGDVARLADYFLAVHSERLGRSGLSFAQSTVEVLEGWQWPGNVRELENTIERAVLLGMGPAIEPRDLPSKLLTNGAVERRAPSVSMTTSIAAPATTPSQLPDAGVDLRSAVEVFENDLIKQALSRTNWNKNQAARLLGLNRTTLVEMLKRKGLADDKVA